MPSSQPRGMIIHILSGLSEDMMIAFTFRLLFSFVLSLLFTFAALSPAPASAQSASCSPAKPAVEYGERDFTLISGDEHRFYNVFVPSGYDPAQPVPLVLTLHGFAGNAAQQAEYSDWAAVAERETFIVVHPEGTEFPRRWHPYGGDVSYMRRGMIDDVQFFRDLLARLSEDYCIDPAQIYVNGLSNGGGMTYRLACELSDQIAAVGIVAGAVQDENCNPTRPVPAIVFHGTDDPIVNYLGREDLTAVAVWVASWAARNGCDPAPAALPDQGDVTGVAYDTCDDSANVVFYTVQGGGHTWPGASGLPRFLVGETTYDINATEAIWQFFTQHRLAGNE